MEIRPSTSVVLLLFLALVVGCESGQADDPARTAQAQLDRIERIVVATGTIEPQTEVEVRPRVPGIVQQILVKEGEAVTEGQLLVEIEHELLEARAEEAKAALDEARVSLRFAHTELIRAQALEHGGAHSRQQVDDKQAQHDRARAAMAGAEARHKNLSTQLSYAQVRSPMAGRVLSVLVEEGSAVSPVTSVSGGTIMVSLAATDRLHLKGRVDENEISRIRVGNPSRIRTEAFPERVFKGELAEISPVGERIQNVTYFQVKVVVVDSDAQLLRPRMSGDADVIAEVVEDAIVVPESALHYSGDEVQVQIVGVEGTKARPVRIGIVDGSRVQILDGLQPGDTVALQ